MGWKKPSSIPKPKKPAVYEESRIQKECVHWFRIQFKAFTLFSIPNGGKRGGHVGILIGEGMLPGVADLFLMFPSRGYHGMFIEIKKPGGEWGVNQKRFKALCEKAGYFYCLSYSLEEFQKQVFWYLGINKNTALWNNTKKVTGLEQS